MNISDFLSNYLLQVSNHLNASDTYLTIFATILGAVLGVVLTVIFGWIAGLIKTLSYNRIVRQQLICLVEDNFMRCNSNLGILNNELSRPNINDGKLTLTGISNLIDYPTLILHSPANFRSTELYILRMQISALNAHHAQLVNVVQLRDSLSVEIRKAPVGQMEWELVALRQEYNSYLKNKYTEIIQYTEHLQEYLNIETWKRFLFNFARISTLNKMRKDRRFD